MQQDTSGKELFQSKDFLKKAYRGALIPCMLSILSGCANNIADGMIVGQLIGAAGLTAINLCVPVYLVLCILGSFFVSGAAISASNEIGQDNDEQAQKYYGIALTACLVSSLVAPQFDDITMMCLLYKGQEGKNERGEALDQ